MHKPPATSDLRNRLIALLPRLRRYALSLTGSMPDAEDLLHSTIERALARADQFQDGSELDRWVFRICKNLWFDEWRKRKIRGPSVDPEDVKHEPSVDGERHAENRVKLKELTEALQAMQIEQREVLVLVVIEGYSYREVSDQLDVPIGTVMSRLARARTKLGALMPETRLSTGKAKP